MTDARGEFEGKVVLVTGASSGVGKATADAFVAAGATVAITGRRREPLDELVSGWTDGGARARDVSDERR